MINIQINVITLLPMSSSSNYSCNYCTKSYILKHNYEKHASVCEFFYKSNKENTDVIDNDGPVPTMKDMYSLVQDLAHRIQKLEKENTNLKQRTNKQNNPLSILKNVKPDLVFSQWLRKYMLPEIKHHLHSVLENTLSFGIQSLFQDVFGEMQDQSCAPVQYYPNKQHNMYVYETDDDKCAWRIATNDDLEKYIRLVTNEFHNQFRIWCENNKETVDRDEELFSLYYRKILSDDKLCKRKIKQQICSQLTSIGDD